MQKRIEELTKYQVNPVDWNIFSLVKIKRKSENIVSLFNVLENLIAPNVSPEQMELLDVAKYSILKQYDAHIGQCYGTNL
jgi:hypothetical protein